MEHQFLLNLLVSIILLFFVCLRRKKPRPPPPLSWRNVPDGTKSLAITMYDPDVPKQVKKEGYFDHWAIFNIPATTTSLIASSTVGTLGNNGSGKAAYTGPCPPPQYEPKEHRYIFTLYAL